MWHSDRTLTTPDTWSCPIWDTCVSAEASISEVNNIHALISNKHQMWTPGSGILQLLFIYFLLLVAWYFDILPWFATFFNYSTRNMFLARDLFGWEVWFIFFFSFFFCNKMRSQIPKSRGTQTKLRAYAWTALNPTKDDIWTSPWNCLRKRHSAWQSAVTVTKIMPSVALSFSIAKSPNFKPNGKHCIPEYWKHSIPKYGFKGKWSIQREKRKMYLLIEI